MSKGSNREKIEIFGWTDKHIEISELGGAIDLLGSFTQKLERVTWDKTAVPIRITIELVDEKTVLDNLPYHKGV